MSEFAGLFRPASLQPFYTAERCQITEYMNTPQSTAVSLAECRVAPGVTTQLHSLTVAERYVIQRGHGLMELAGDDPERVIPFASQLRLYHDNRVKRVCMPQPENYPQGEVYLRTARSGEGAIGGNAASFLTSF